MNTAYVDHESNFSEVCKACFDEEEEWLKEMWDEFYSSRM